MTVIDDTAQAKPRHKVRALTINQPTEPRTVPVAPSELSILQQAVERGATGEDLKNMLDLYERLEDRKARRAFDDAMAQVQSEMPTIIKTKLVSLGGSKTYAYEDLDSVVRTIRPVMHKYGLAHRWRTEDVGDQIKVTCIITGHGHREENSMQAPPDTGPGRNPLQARGSTIAYLERYTIKAALGLSAAVDDDGRGGHPDRGGSDENNIITEQQLKEIIELIENGESDADLICSAMVPPITNLKEMNQRQFKKVKERLLKKIAQMDQPL